MDRAFRDPDPTVFCFQFSQTLFPNQIVKIEAGLWRFLALGVLLQSYFPLELDFVSGLHKKDASEKGFSAGNARREWMRLPSQNEQK